MATGLLSSTWTPENFYTAYLSADITDTATDIFLDVVPVNSEGTLVIDPDSDTNREVIYYSSKTGTKVVCPANGRGYDSSTAASHLTGTKVIMAPIADWFTSLKTLFTTTPQGWSDLGSTPDTVTYNGNGSYSMVFNSNDLTDTVSNGMRLKCTRTVTAPTQCTDLESGSSQYYSKTTPAGAIGIMTDDITCMGWVKLESYGGVMSIVSKYNGTSGFVFDVLSTGQLRILGANAGNIDKAESYQSLPLGKWCHVAGSLDMSGASGLLYINGVLVPSLYTNGSGSAFVQAGNLEIGSANATSFMDGKIAQVGVFNAVISASTIRSYSSQTLSGSETNCVGAWSFNNSIADLSANANNLTPNAGAVATNADSPFGQQADGTTAGTTEYAIITKTAFSTNTTLTVQVPEGCALPTSGGISAVSYSTQKAPYGFPAQRNRWLLEARMGYNYTSAANPTGWQNTTYQLTIPVGDFEYGYDCVTISSRAANGTLGSAATLSTTTSTETDTRMTDFAYGANDTTRLAGLRQSDFVSLSTATPYYLLIQPENAGTYTAIGLNAGSNRGSHKIWAIPSGL